MDHFLSFPFFSPYPFPFFFSRRVVVCNCQASVTKKKENKRCEIGVFPSSGLAQLSKATQTQFFEKLAESAALLMAVIVTAEAEAANWKQNQLLANCK